jgi:cytoskeletal protein RodZ
MTPGQALAARREERGLSIEQVAAATRIGAGHLRALEADDIGRIAAPVYARGYLRTYAMYLGLDPDALTADLPSRPQPALDVKLGVTEPRPHVVITTPAIAAALVVLLAGAFAGYAWRQVTAERRAGQVLSSPSPLITPAATPVASPAVQARPIVVGVRVTDTVWINATVDGTPQYGDSGRTLSAGSVVYFTGLDVKITSGKAAATFISIDGKNLGAMGVGVATREFTSQTSP